MHPIFCCRIIIQLANWCDIPLRLGTLRAEAPQFSRVCLSNGRDFVLAGFAHRGMEIDGLLRVIPHHKLCPPSAKSVVRVARLTIRQPGNRIPHPSVTSGVRSRFTVASTPTGTVSRTVCVRVFMVAIFLSYLMCEYYLLHQRAALAPLPDKKISGDQLLSKRKIAVV